MEGPSWRELLRRPGALGLGLSQVGQTLAFYLTIMALTVGAARMGDEHVLGLSALFVAMALPPIFVGPLVAPWVERQNKRTMMRLGQFGKSLTLLVVALFPGLGTLAVGGFLIMAFHTIYLPGYRSLLSEVAQGDDQIRLTSAIHTGTTAMQLVGMGLGGVLAIFTHVEWAVAAAGVVFALSASATVLIPRTLSGLASGRPSGTGSDWRSQSRGSSTSRKAALEPSYGRQIREGVRAVSGAPVAVRLLMVMGVLSLAIYVMNPVLVLIPRRVLGVPLWWYPTFEVTQAVFAMLLGGILSARLSLPSPRLMGLGMLACGTAVVALALSRSAILDAAIYAVIGLAQMAQLPVAMALYRNQFPLPVRARAAATYSMVVGAAQALGSAFAGILTHDLGVAGALGAAGVGILVAAGIGLWTGLFRASEAREPDVAKAASS